MGQLLVAITPRGLFYRVIKSGFVWLEHGVELPFNAHRVLPAPQTATSVPLPPWEIKGKSAQIFGPQRSSNDEKEAFKHQTIEDFHGLLIGFLTISYVNKLKNMK